MQQGHKNYLVVVAGPTASGKTSLAIALAQHFNTEILSFDSRQCYAELNIGVARPGPEELAAVPHHFIASHSIHYPIDAAGFAAYAKGILDKIFATRNMAIAVGGTGLYLKALIEGLDDIPAIDVTLRQSLRAQYEHNGLQWLSTELKQHDSAWLQQGDAQNPHRMLRALEVVMQTGKSITSFQKQKQQTSETFSAIHILLSPPREVVYDRINQRTETMMREGLLEEATTLIPYQQLQPLQTVGYAELFAFFNDEYTLEVAVEKIKQHTRNYAKRQLTWWRKHEGLILSDSLELQQAIDYIKESVAAD